MDLGYLTGTFPSCSANCDGGDRSGSLEFPNIMREDTFDYFMDDVDLVPTPLVYFSNSPSCELDFGLQSDFISPSDQCLNGSSKGELLTLIDGRIVSLTKDILVGPLDQFNSYTKEHQRSDGWCALDEMNAKDFRRRLQNRKHSEKNRLNRRAKEKNLISEVITLRSKVQRSRLEFTQGVVEALKQAFPQTVFNSETTTAFLGSVETLAEKHLNLI